MPIGAAQAADFVEALFAEGEDADDDEYEQRQIGQPVGNSLSLGSDQRHNEGRRQWQGGEKRDQGVDLCVRHRFPFPIL